ncbi:MAG: glycosyltransferase family 2 protein [Anaerolineae bacterium]
MLDPFAPVPIYHESPHTMRIAVVIPAYCAAASIERVLRGIPPLVELIIVVDDASTDATADVVSALQPGDGRIHLVRHAQNQGVGGTVLSGYARALELGAGIAVKMDSDDQMDPAFLPALLRPILSGQADYAKGNRFLHFSELVRMPARRRLGNIGLSLMVKIASGYWNIFDPTNGYTAIDTRVLARLDANRIDKRYFFESSMLLELGMVQAVVRDVPIPARYGGESSRLSEKDALRRFPSRLARAFWRRVLVQYFIRDFSAVSLFMVFGLAALLFGVIFGVWKWIVSGISGIPATTGTVMIAVLPVIIGLQLILQAVVMDIQNVPRTRIADDLGG